MVGPLAFGWTEKREEGETDPLKKKNRKEKGIGNWNKKNAASEQGTGRRSIAARRQGTGGRDLMSMVILQRQLEKAEIGVFKILQVLGQGCNGIVFLVEVNLRGRPDKLALKMILNYQALSTRSLDNEYENELNILNKEIKEVNLGIIQLIHEFTCEPTLEMIGHVDPSVKNLLCSTNRRTGAITPVKTKFFVLEFHPTTLEHKLEQLGSNITPDQILSYSFQFCDSLKFLFKSKIVHRDIKLNNILVDDDDKLVISDFGESLKLDDRFCCHASQLRGGNQQYTAPEVLNAIFGKKTMIDFSGQFSWDAGCVLFEIAMGEFPFVGYPVGFGEAPNIHVPEADFTSWNGRLPLELLNVIKELLANNPSQRMSIIDAHSILSNLV